jgi:hypothetical protein
MSAFVPSATLVMSFPFEGLSTLANRSDNVQCIRRSTHLLDSLALTAGPKFATNEDTGGDTGLTLPGGSVEGIFETVVAHVGFVERESLMGLEISQMTRGYIPTYRIRISTSPDHGGGGP